MIRIGKIVATHGLQGALILTHVLENSNWLKKGDKLFLEINKGSHIPYFVSTCKKGKTGEYIITVDDVITVQESKKLVTKSVYVEEETISMFSKQSPLLWVGFTIIDVQKGDIGNIDDILFTGTQWLAKLKIEKKEVLIPLIEQTIQKIDVKNRIIEMELPEGLLDIYLS